MQKLRVHGQYVQERDDGSRDQPPLFAISVNGVTVELSRQAWNSKTYTRKDRTTSYELSKLDVSRAHLLK